MPGTARKTPTRNATKTDEVPQPDQAPVSDPSSESPAPNAEQQVAAAQGAAPIDFAALLATAEEEPKASRKSNERADVDVPQEWIDKVKDAAENRKRVRIPGITTKDLYQAVGDLIRAAADRIERSATVRASYSLPVGAEDTKENRVLSGLTFTVGPRREGPKGKKETAPANADTADGSTETADSDAAVDAHGAPSGD